MSSGTQHQGTELSDVGQGLQALVQTLRILFFCLRILIVLSFAYLLLSGVFYVREHEEAMLFRFGKLTTKDGQEILTSGKWYWAWPYPIDRVKRVPAQRSITLSTATTFWPNKDPNVIDAMDPAEEDATGGAGLVPGTDGYVVTGDFNIMHMIWTLTYRVTDAKRYYLAFFDDSEGERGADARPAAPGVPERPRGAERAIQNALSQSVLAEVGAWPVESVWSLSRVEGGTAVGESLSGAVRRRVNSLLTQLDLGIEVQQVSLFEIQPPVSVQGAFREVVDAAVEAQTAREEAHAYERRVLPGAEGEASRIVAEARAYKTRTVESVKADAGYFKKVLAEYEKHPESMLVALHQDVIREVLGRVEDKWIVHAKKGGRQEIRLRLGPEPKKPRPTTEHGDDHSDE